MSYTLYIGDRTFSSWSYRGWLMLEKFGLPHSIKMTGLYAGTLADDLADIAPATTVPAMTTPEGNVLTDSLSMAETLAEQNPSVGLWPRKPAARILARNLVAEMHSGFMPLREHCPNMICCTWDGFEPNEGVLKNVARIEYLWSLARERHGQDGPWLFGEYSLADVFYAPVAFRMTTFKLPISEAAKSYVALHLNDPAFAVWKAEADKEVYDPFPYDLGLSRDTWPASEG